MAGTRIFVLQLKDVIKTTLFAVLGLVLVLLLVYLFVPRGKDTESAGSGALYIPGTYTAEIMLNESPVAVNVTVSADEILTVRMMSLEETQAVFYPLVQPVMDTLAKEIVKYQTADLTPSSEYPVTGEIILDAVRTALDKARIDAGKVAAK
ncbi:MAG: hypothetical protein LBS84_12485 [Clostridiales bacterium]|jgi:uncharacterized protein with FMN-binding domain|nr:hypothetical protein [Clostridiales bacterium]